MSFNMVNEFQERTQFAVPKAGASDVVNETGCIQDVVCFLVSKGEPAENASNLQMPLQSHPFHLSVKSTKVIPQTLLIKQAFVLRKLPIANGDVKDKLLRPRDKGIPHQTGNVVGDGPMNGILKVKNPQPFFLGVPGNHQVSGHEVSMHKNLRGAQVVLNDLGENGVEQCRPLFFQRTCIQALVLDQIPIMKQGQFSLEKRLVISWEDMGQAAQLPGDQLSDGFFEKHKGLFFGRHYRSQTGESKMIVEKFWKTVKRENEPGYTTIFHDYVYTWKGWFLFGIVPLYIKQTEKYQI